MGRTEANHCGSCTGSYQLELTLTTPHWEAAGDFASLLYVIGPTRGSPNVARDLKWKARRCRGAKWRIISHESQIGMPAGAK